MKFIMENWRQSMLAQEDQKTSENIRKFFNEMKLFGGDEKKDIYLRAIKKSFHAVKLFGGERVNSRVSNIEVIKYPRPEDRKFFARSPAKAFYMPGGSFMGRPEEIVINQSFFHRVITDYKLLLWKEAQSLSQSGQADPSISILHTNLANIRDTILLLTALRMAPTIAHELEHAAYFHDKLQALRDTQSSDDDLRQYFKKGSEFGKTRAKNEMLAHKVSGQMIEKMKGYRSFIKNHTVDWLRSGVIDKIIDDVFKEAFLDNRKLYWNHYAINLPPGQHEFEHFPGAHPQQKHRQKIKSKKSPR